VSSNLRKSALELHIGVPFTAYLAECGLPSSNIRQGNPDQHEPDIVGETPAGPVGVEVTTILWSAESWRNLDATISGHPERSSARLVLGGDPQVLARRSAASRRWQAEDRKQRDKRGLSTIQPEQPSDRLALLALEKIADKCGKSYCMPTYLVVDATENAIVSAKYGHSLADELRVPSPSPFKAIYLAGC
jgi:hypothetical protein